MPQPPEHPLIPQLAVVVIGRNEGDRLKTCLESVLTMNYPQASLKIVYVDSNSADDSVRMATDLGVDTIPLTRGTMTAARARNAGWKECRAPFILFLDGDTVLHPDFARRALQPMSDPSIAGVWGNRRESNTGGSLYNAVCDLDWMCSPGWTPFFGGDALVRRAALEAAGGFDETLIAGEEPDLCRRMRGLDYRILHIDVPMTWHDMAIVGFPAYWRRSLRTGHAYAQVSARYQQTADPLWREESRRNTVRGILWIVVPITSIAASLRTASIIPIALLSIAAAVLMSRSAWKIRWKTPSKKILIMYGLHSHLQQIPILFGQIRFWSMRALKKQSRLIEYKSTTWR